MVKKNNVDLTATLRDVIVAVKTQQEIQQTILLSNVLATLDAILQYDSPEIIVHLRNGWVSHIEGLPEGMRFVVVDDTDIKAR
jgi:hypothetical protein